MAAKSISDASTAQLVSAADHPVSPAPLVVAEGTLQTLKWFALVVMALDHVNKFGFRERLPYVFELGRSVLPIFAFVLAYNLARPSAQSNGAYRRTMMRLSIAGLISVPIVSALNAPLVSKWSWWPLNVLFMFMLAIALPLLWRRRRAEWRVLAVVGFVIGGALVEYFWFGLFCCWGSYSFCRRPNLTTFSVWVLSVLLLTMVNGNLWALAAIPLLLLAAKLTITLPRSKWAFYVFYPLHLVLILVVLRLAPLVHGL
jgi:hypothetical protein